MNYGGERVLNCTNRSSMYKAAFKVHENSSVLTVDLSNALPLDKDMLVGNGSLFLAIIHIERQCVELISSDSIPYLRKNWIKRTAGVVDYKLSLEQLNNLLSSATLVLVQKNNTGELENYSECGQKCIFKCYGNKFIVLLSETQYYVQPTILYQAQLE